MSSTSIYHRLESPTQKSKDAQRQEKSREIWGKPARFSGIPKVKAYTGILPANQRGVESLFLVLKTAANNNLVIFRRRLGVNFYYFWITLNLLVNQKFLPVSLGDCHRKSLKC